MSGINVGSVRSDASVRTNASPPRAITLGGVTIMTKDSVIARYGTEGGFFQANVAVRAQGDKPVALSRVTVHAVDPAGNLGAPIVALDARGVPPYFEEVPGPGVRTDYYALPLGTMLDLRKRYALVSEVGVRDQKGLVATPPLRIYADDV